MTLLFNKSDVEAAGHPLVRMLRLIFYRNKITLDRFATLYADHGRTLGRSKEMTNIAKNNAQKTLHRDQEDMTWRFFHYILVNVLRLDILEVRVVVRMEKTGELIEIGSNDSVDQPLRVLRTDTPTE